MLTRRIPLTPLLLTISSRLPHGYALVSAKGNVSLSPYTPGSAVAFGATLRFAHSAGYDLNFVQVYTWLGHTPDKS